MPEARIGVGVLILRNGKVLFGKRKGNHGGNTYAPPGGHLELGETPEQTAARETLEETGLKLKNIKRGPYTNDIHSSEKHYITLFFIAEADGEPQLMEPHKCESWDWHDWDKLPLPLFLSIENLKKTGFNPNNPKAL